MLARYAGWYAPVAWTVPSSWAHAYLMLYGFFPFFMFGFLMAAIPNWLDVEVRRRRLCGLLRAHGGRPGVVLCRSVGRVGDHGHGHRGSTGGVWGVAVAALARVIVVSPPQSKADSLILVGALTLGWLGALAFLLWLWSGAVFWAELSRRGGIWFFALPVFLTISNRMVPVFSSRVIGESVMARPGRCRCCSRPATRNSARSDSTKNSQSAGLLESVLRGKQAALLDHGGKEKVAASLLLREAPRGDGNQSESQMRTNLPQRFPIPARGFKLAFRAFGHDAQIHVAVGPGFTASM